MKMIRASKWCVFGGVLVIVSVILMGCSGGSLSENFDEVEVIEAAEMIVDLINVRDAEGLLELSTPRLKTALTGDVLEEVFNAISEGGAFVAIDSLHVRGMTDKASGEAYAVVTARARYEHKSFIYTISFSEEMNLAGLYYR